MKEEESQFNVKFTRRLNSLKITFGLLYQIKLELSYKPLPVRKSLLPVYTQGKKLNGSLVTLPMLQNSLMSVMMFMVFPMISGDVVDSPDLTCKCNNVSGVPD